MPPDKAAPEKGVNVLQQPNIGGLIKKNFVSDGSRTGIQYFGN